MRTIIGILLATTAVGAQMQPASTMSDLMVKIIYPASDALFYITTREPNESQLEVALVALKNALKEDKPSLIDP